MASLRPADGSVAAPLPGTAIDATSVSAVVPGQLTPNEAIDVYTECCAAAGMGVNRHFVKLLLQNRSEYDFAGGYLGAHGIVPVVRTMSRLSVVSINLRSCALEVDEIRAVCDAFRFHPQLAKIDLRENIISDAAAKLLIQLVKVNRRIVDVLVGKGTPRYMRLQNELVKNSRCAISAEGSTDAGLPVSSVGMCLVCADRFEQNNASRLAIANVNLLFSTILTHFTRATGGASAVGVEAIFALLQCGCEAGDGELFLCSNRCSEQFGLELLRCSRHVVTSCHLQLPSTPPQLPFFRQATDTLIKDVASRALPPEAFLAVPAGDELPARDYSISRYLDGTAADGCQARATRCSVCSSTTDGLAGVAALFIRQLRADSSARPLTAKGTVGDNATLSPSTVITRLSQSIVGFLYEPFCSAACIQDIVRFGLYGYGGVIRTNPQAVPLLSSAAGTTNSPAAAPAGAPALRAAIDARLFPLASFSVVDFASVTIDDIGEEDTICALAVASAIEDIDGVPIDPYFLHAMGRQIGGQTPPSLGSELQCVCEAARISGSLAQAESPFERRRGDRPARRRATQARGGAGAQQLPARPAAAGFSTGNWASWGEAFGEEAVRRMLHCAYARQRQGLYVVDGPHSNLFDNTRAALWKYRTQRRSILVALDFNPDWLPAGDGIIMDSGYLPCVDEDGQAVVTKPAENARSVPGFYTVVKVVGQSVIANSVYLILQGYFGPNAGNRGFFYMDKSTFLRCVTGNAYMFVDAAAFAQGRGDQGRLFSREVSSPESVNIAAHVAHGKFLLREVLTMDQDAQMPSAVRRRVLEAIAQHLRRASTDVFGDSGGADGTPYSTMARRRWLTYLAHVLQVEGPLAVSQLLFVLTEIANADTSRWFSDMIASIGLEFPSLGHALLADSTPASPRAADPAQGNDLTTPVEWLLVSPRAAPPTSAAKRGRKGRSGPESSSSTRSTHSPLTRSSPQRVSSPAGPCQDAPVKAPAARGGSGGGRSRSRSSSEATSRASSRKSSKDVSKSESGSRAGKPRRPSAGKNKQPSSGKAKRNSAITRSNSNASSSTSSTKPSPKPRRGTVATPVKAGSPQAADARTTAQATETVTGSPSPPAAEGPPLDPRSVSRRPSAPPLDPVPSHLIGKPWNLVHIASGAAHRIRYVAAFIEDYVCVLCLDTPGEPTRGATGIAMPLMPIRANPLFSELPFLTGFDCAFNHPLRPREVILISGTMAVVWDSYLQVCTGAPFPLASSPMLGRFPDFARSEGERKIDCVVAIPGTPLIIIFAQLMYAVYDIEAGAPVSEPTQLLKRSTAEDRMKEDGLLYMAEEARAAAAAKANRTGADSDPSDLAEGLLWTKLMPLLGNDIVESLVRSPVAAAWLPPATEAASAGLSVEGEASVAEHPTIGTAPALRTVSLILADGTVITAGLPTDPARWKNTPLAIRSVSEMASTRLAALPVVFQQSRLSSLPALCAASVTALSEGSSGDFELYAPDGDDDSSEPVVSSSLQATKLARARPVTLISLDAPQPVTGSPRKFVADTLAAHVHFRGDPVCKRGTGEQPRRSTMTLGNHSPVMAHTATTDVGSGCYEMFSAMVLVLDTSSVHPLVFRHAPFRAAVEVSEEGVIFRELTQFVVGSHGDGSVTACAWGEEAHAARYWQVRFLSDLPPEVGLVKVLWYRAGTRRAVAPCSSCAPLLADDFGALECLRTYMVPRDFQRTNVLIDGPSLFCEAINLLNHTPAKPVFTTATSGPNCTSEGWYYPHAVLPLLQRSSIAPFFAPRDTVLAFCGPDFVEFDMAACDVVDRRSLCLIGHPAFRDLPFPFNKGIQSAFYTNPATRPDWVTLLADGWLIQWDLATGLPVDDLGVTALEHFNEAAAFAGVPVHCASTHELVAIVNDWARPAELLVLTSVRGTTDGGCRARSVCAIDVLHWDFTLHTLVGNPMPMLTHPLFAAQLADAKPTARLHALFMTYDRIPSFTLFLDDSVLGRHGTEGLSVSKDYFRLRHYLTEFGVPKSTTTVTIDLRDSPILAAGFELHSTPGVVDGVGEQWVAAYSDDMRTWTSIGLHTHYGQTSRATWLATQVGAISHRFWRLTSATALAPSPPRETTAPAPPTDGDPLFLYTHLRLLCFNHHACLQAPNRIACSPGAVMSDGAEPRDLFRLPEHEGVPSSPAARRPATLTLQPGPSHMTIDYGRCEPELLGLTCTRTRPAAECAATDALRGLMDIEQWHISCSEDGATWFPAGTWPVRCTEQKIQLHWAPVRPARYWRVAVTPLEIDSSHQTLSNLRLWENSGPTVFICAGCRGEVTATAVAHPSASVLYPQSVTAVPELHLPAFKAREKMPPYHRPAPTLLPATIGSTLTFDTKATTAAALTGITIVCDPSIRTSASAPPPAGLPRRIELLAEFSPNGTHWYAATEMLYFAGQQQPVHGRWGMLGSHRYWRVRVVDVDGPEGGELVITTVRLLQAEQRLYRAFLSQTTQHEATAVHLPVGVPSAGSLPRPGSATAAAEVELVYLRLASQQPIVRVTASLPPASSYLVERLALDGIGWEQVGLLQNTGTAQHVEVLQAWPRGLPSSTWRLRGLTASAAGGDPASALSRLRLPVTWESFADERPVAVDLNNVNGLSFCNTGFTEVMAAELLFRGKTALDATKVVLTADPAATAAEAVAALEGRPGARGSIGSRNPHSPRVPDTSLEWFFPAPVALSFFSIKGALLEKPAPPRDGEPAEVPVETAVRRGTTKRRSLAGKPFKESAARRAGSVKSRSPRAKKGERAAAAEAAAAEPAPEAAPPPPATIVVETSMNGVDFVPVAATILAGIEHGKTLSWERHLGTPASHWRVRFEHISATSVLELVSATWSLLCGVPGVSEPSDDLVTSNTAYTAWQSDVFSNEENFTRTCQLGFDQAKSQDAKLREEGDVARNGTVAHGVWSLKRRYAASIGKLSKEIGSKAGSADDSLLKHVPQPIAHLFGSGRELVTDLLYFVARVGQKYPESEAMRLISLANSPLNVSRGLVLSKRDSTNWFYPNHVMYGGLDPKADFHGIPGGAVTAAFVMYWSLSTALQRDASILVVPPSGGPTPPGRGVSRPRSGGGLCEVSPHVASPMLTVHWEHKSGAEWVAAECFPELPVLGYAGFGYSGGDSPADASCKSHATMLVCAVNDVPFSNRFPLSIGDAKQAAAIPPPVFPFSVRTGVNFVHFAPVPSFLAETLRILYRANFLEAYRTTIVLTAPSLASTTCQIRFTLPATEGTSAPGGNANFGMRGVSIESLEFEVSLIVTPLNLLAASAAAGGLSLASKALPPGGPTYSASMDGAERVSLRKRQYGYDFQVNVISHGATYSLPAVDPSAPAPAPHPISMVANLDAASRTIPLRCRVPNANMPLRFLPAAVISQFDVSATVERAEDGSFYCPDTTVTGTMVVAGSGRPFPCTYTVPAGVPWDTTHELHADFLGASLDEFVLCTRVLLNAEDSGSTALARKQSAAQREWLAALPIRCGSFNMCIDLIQCRIDGVAGYLTIYDAKVRDATVSVSRDGFLISGSVAKVSVGNLVIEGAAAGQHSHGAYLATVLIGDMPSTWDIPSAGRQSTGEAHSQSRSPPDPSPLQRRQERPAAPAPIIVRIVGRSRLTSGTRSMPATAELSQDRMLCIGSVNSVDVSLAATNAAIGGRRETVSFNAVHPLCETAQVALNSSLFFRKIAAALGEAPLVKALRAHRLPFTFSPQEISVVEPMRVAQHRFSVVLRGVFFGSWFEVFTTATDLAESGRHSVDDLCNTLALGVLEQSEDALWKCYANVVGMRVAPAGPDPGSFLALWASAEGATRAMTPPIALEE